MLTDSSFFYFSVNFNNTYYAPWISRERSRILLLKNGFVIDYETIESTHWFLQFLSFKLSFISNIKNIFCLFIDDIEKFLSFFS